MKNYLLLISLFAGCLSGGSFCSTASANEGGKGNHWALLIGVDDYISVKDLRYCGPDQRDLRAQLIASGFPEKQVFLMHSKAEQAQYLPIRTNIEKQLELLLGMVEENDIIYIAFSGHGVQLGSENYLCPADASLSDMKSLISLKSVYQQLQNSAGSLKMIIVDACRNDPRHTGQRTTVQGKQVEKFARNVVDVIPPQGVVLLNSCAPGEVSWEDPDVGHGVFMHFVLGGIRGQADKDRNGLISLAELAAYVSLQTKLHVAKKFNESQRPYLKGNLDLDALNYALVSTAGTSPAPIPPRPMDKPDSVMSQSPIDLLKAPFTKAEAESAQRAWARHLKTEVESTNSVGMSFRLIPPGEFPMGSPASEAYKKKDENQHRVQFVKPFRILTTEVTQAQWEAIMGTRPWGDSQVVNSGPNYPATQINWYSANEFCEKLSEKEGKKYRLPTEAEWEYCCRAGVTTMLAYEYGNDGSRLDNYAWHRGNAYSKRERYPHQVRRKNPNQFGLYDMYGNAEEWCSDWYDPNYYSVSPVLNPQGPESGRNRVLRGGSWLSPAPDPSWSSSCIRSANRSYLEPSAVKEIKFKRRCLGFRVVLEQD